MVSLARSGRLTATSAAIAAAPTRLTRRCFVMTLLVPGMSDARKAALYSNESAKVLPDHDDDSLQECRSPCRRRRGRRADGRVDGLARAGTEGRDAAGAPARAAAAGASPEHVHAAQDESHESGGAVSRGQVRV